MTALDFPAPKQQFMHRWLYSVVPAYDDTGAIFLSGYCPNCSRVFSIEIPKSAGGDYRETQTVVPRWGCVGEY